MATQAAPIGTDRVQYTGYFFDGDSGWRLLSRIEVNRGDKDWSLDGLYSFVEQWTGTDPEAVRSASFGPGWITGLGGGVGQWIQIESASFTYGTAENHLHVNAFNSESDGGIGLATGGDVVRGKDMYDVLSYEKVEVIPSLVLDFDAKIGCLEAASDKVAIEHCLAATRSPTTSPTMNPTATATTPTPTPTPTSTSSFPTISSGPNQQPGWCASSPQQLCKMACANRPCPSENDCAMRKGTCCDYECQESAGSQFSAGRRRNYLSATTFLIVAIAHLAIANCWLLAAG